MLNQRRRKRPGRTLKPIFSIVCEGKTERAYFCAMKGLCSNWHIEVECSNNKSDPISLLGKATDQIKRFPRGSLVAIVCDKDNWNEKQLKPLLEYQKKDRCFLIFSAPQFEYWLVLHKGVGARIQTSTECMDKMNKLFPNYKKPIIPKEILNIDSIHHAISEAKKDNVPEFLNELPEKGTNCYALLERILNPRK